MCPTSHSKQGLEEDLHGCICSCPMITKASNLIKRKWFPSVEWQWLRQGPPLLACRVAAKPMWGHALSSRWEQWLNLSIKQMKVCPEFTERKLWNVTNSPKILSNQMHVFCMVAFRGARREWYPFSFRMCFCMFSAAIKGWTPAATKVEAAGISSSNQNFIGIVAMSALNRYLAREAQVALGLWPKGCEVHVMPVLFYLSWWLRDDTGTGMFVIHGLWSLTFACALSKHGHLNYCKRESGRLASANLQVLAVFHLYTLNLPFCCAVSSAWIVLVVHMHTCRSKTVIIWWLTATERAF